MKTNRRKFHLYGLKEAPGELLKTMCGMVIADPALKTRLFIWDPQQHQQALCARCRWNSKKKLPHLQNNPIIP